MAHRGAESTTTFLEDYVDSLSGLPNDLRRLVELMRDLDKEGTSVSKELEDTEKKVLSELKKRQRQTGNLGDYTAVKEDIAAKRRRAEQMVDEKVQVSEQMVDLCDVHLTRLQQDIRRFEDYLRANGEYSAGVASAGDQVAVQVEEEWILGRVWEYDIAAGVYTVGDEDEAEKTFQVSDAHIIRLEQLKLSKGEEVLAVYPDTTSFYPAIVTSVSRKMGGALAGDSSFCTVQFHDDEDDSGINPDRSVKILHIIRPPDEGN
uniref:SGF29 C-terminal domain-containing protein n=1 Tax=Rhizochromulina marina TaxID=1034831 RepID=A0A7S2W6R2_9STRA|mmetsp:Transcript_15397/g.45603  ORF Transcript_15397/g.45603 Transcript_15397/m.45603 type:complete len:261 (+) Transcript_15397:27-809(+)